MKFKISRLVFFALGVLCLVPASAQRIITTIAGTDLYSSRRVQPGLEAPLGEVSGGAADAAGNIFFCDRRTQQVLRLAPDGSLTIVAGNGLSGFPDRTLQIYLPYPAFNTAAGDGGPAVNALLNDPTSVVVDTDGTLYIADRINQRIRRVTPDGMISTYAGGGKPASGNGDGGAALSASFSDPFGLALDPSGNLYVSDVTTSSIRKITRGGVITTFAGNGRAAVSPPGTAAAGNPLSYPAHMAFANGVLYVAELRAQRVISIAADGLINVVAGTGTLGFAGDGGAPLAAQLNNPAGVAVDSSGAIYIADTGNGRIRRISNGVITTLAGTGLLASGGDGGAANKADLLLPTAVSLDSRGNVYIASARTGRMRRVRPDGVIETAAGNGVRSNVVDRGPALNATLNLSLDPACQGYKNETLVLSTYPSLASDAAGNVYFAEPPSNRIRRITTGGILETVAGTGVAGFSGDNGPALQAALNNPIAVATGPNGQFFLVDANNSRLRYVDSGGVIRSPINIQGIDAAANLQLDSFLFPRDRILFGAKMAVDSNGVLYTALGSRIYQQTPSGALLTIDTKLPIGGGNVPLSIAVDPSGALFAATQRQVFRVALNGTTTAIAGTGAYGAGGGAGDGGLATNATFGIINSIAFDAAGNLYISDWSGGVIRRVGLDGNINRVAGSGACGNSGDGGSATDATLDPRAISIDGLGRLLILSGDRIRAVLPQLPQFTASPASLAFSGAATGAPAQPQTIALTTAVAEMPFTAHFEPPAPWLQLSTVSGRTPRLLSVTADPGQLAPGTYPTSVVLDVAGANPGEIRVPVTFTVGPAQPVALTFDRDALTFFIPRSGGPRTAAVLVRNSGGGQADFDAAISFNGSSGWLTLNPAHASALPRQPAALALTADPAGLAPGTYTASVNITRNGSRAAQLPVILIVSDRDQALSLTQSGLSFTAVQEGGVVPPQSFGVANAGTGSFNWSASTSTESGGAQWLSALSGSTTGATTSGQPVPIVNVFVSQTGLAPGRYYGLVTVTSPDVPNSPQVVTVSLEVQARGSNPGAVLVPGQLLFRAAAGGESASSQDLLAYNLSATPVSYTASVSLSPGTTWLRVLPLKAVVNPTEPARITVQSLLRDLFDGSTLVAGDYRGEITLQFSDGVVRSVPLRYTVSATPVSPGTVSTSRLGIHAASDGCLPSKLNPALKTVGQSFGGPAGWPMAMEVEVRDDCGQALDSGNVVVSFSNGDPPLALQTLQDGRWQGTWQTSARAQSVNVRVEASTPDAALKGSLEAPAVLTASQDPPAFAASAIVSAAAAVPLAPLAPRALISIYGDHLAEQLQSSSSVPLPQQLGGTQVVISGRLLPLVFASPGQVNAVVPEDLPVNTLHQVLIRRGVTLSRPVTVTVAPAQPALFSDGQGRAVATAVRSTNGVQNAFTPAPATPAHAGDTLVLYASGLGDVGTLPAGQVSPGNPLLGVKDAVKVSVGGKDAAVYFAGLAPGFVAVYQINAVVPDGVTAGPAVPVNVLAGGQISPVASIAIQ